MPLYGNDEALMNEHERRGGNPAQAILGVADQHDRILALLDELHRDLERGSHTSALRTILGRLSHLAEHHFATEQRILTQHPTLATRWQAEQKAYRDVIAELRANHNAGKPIEAKPALAAIERSWLRHFAWHNEAWLKSRRLDDAAPAHNEQPSASGRPERTGHQTSAGAERT